MEMVKDAGSRQVTFSKRRNGVFKKANELAILCGAEVAVVVFSPGGKPFSFGHPTVDAVAHRFLHLNRGEPKPELGGPSNSSKEGSGKAEKLNKRLVKLMKQLEKEKTKGEMLDKAIVERKLGPGLGLKAGLEDLGDLKNMKRSLEKLRDNVKERVREMEAASSLMLLTEKPVKKDAGKASCFRH